MTPLGSLASPYEARTAPSSGAAAAQTLIPLLPAASNLATMFLLGRSGRKRDGAYHEVYLGQGTNL
jgi:hypothetical protein